MPVFQPIEAIVPDRESWIWQRVDLDRLPDDVSLVLTESRYSKNLGATLSCYGIHASGVQIGEMELSHVEEYPQAALSPANVHLDKNIGQGYGLSSYLLSIQEAQRTDCVFTTGYPTSEKAKKIWDILVYVGIAEVVLPFEQLRDQHKTTKVPMYEGLMRVPVLHA